MRPDLAEFPKQFTLADVERHLQAMLDVFRRHGVAVAYVFGSILDEQASAADLDVAVYWRKLPRGIVDLYLDLFQDLCRVFHADNIDVVMLNDVGPAFRYEVMATGRLVYSESAASTVDLREDTLFAYDDTAGLRKMIGDELRQAIVEGLMKPRPIDPKRITKCLASLRDALSELRRIRGRAATYDEFMTAEHREVRDLCVHHLRIALEAVLDCCRHIVAVQGFGTSDPQLENLIDLLGQRGVIPSEFAGRIRGMTGMRNAIVHVYWEIQYPAIYERVMGGLEDFEEFARHILAYVERGR